MSATFSVANFECPGNSSSRECVRRGGGRKMVWCGDVHFKQRAGTEYLVAETEPVANMHTRLQNVYGVNAVENSCVSRASLVGSAGSGKVQTKLSDWRPSCRPTAASQSGVASTS
jgi:hypothetical protein